MFTTENTTGFSKSDLIIMNEALELLVKSGVDESNASDIINDNWTGTGDTVSSLTRTAGYKSEIVKFYSGDLLNGNINGFDTYEAAYKDYTDMAEGCAETDRGDETVSREQAVEESLAFHYVAKVTTTLDDHGEVIKEDVETLDGGDAEACGYQQ